MSIISEITARLDVLSSKVEQSSSKYEVFSSGRRIGINMEEYMNHLKEKLELDDEVFILSLFLIQKLKSTYSDFRINDFNHMNLFLTSLFLAAKSACDCKFSAKSFSFHGAVPLARLLVMETAFLDLLEWNLYVPDNLALSPSTCYRIDPDIYSNYTSDPCYCVSSADTSDVSFDEDLHWEDNPEFSELSLYFND